MNNEVKTISYSDKTSNCDTTDFSDKRFKKSMDEGKIMVLILVKKEIDQTF